MHGFTSCKTGPMPWSGALTLDDVLAGCYAFLEAHPTETVLFAAKYEHGDASVSQVQQTLDAYLQKNPEAWLLTDTMPTLGQARGRLVLLRRWEDEAGLGARAGLPLLWEDQRGHADPSQNTALCDQGSYRLWVQDRFEYGAEDKWAAFTAGLNPKGAREDDLVLSFLSTATPMDILAERKTGIVSLALRISSSCAAAAERIRCCSFASGTRNITT